MFLSRTYGNRTGFSPTHTVNSTLDYYHRSRVGFSPTPTGVSLVTIKEQGWVLSSFYRSRLGYSYRRIGLGSLNFYSNNLAV